jgi:hypothetical protein
MRPTIPARHAAHSMRRLRLLGRAGDTACEGQSNARKCSKYQFCWRATHGDVTHVHMATACTSAPVRARSVETTPIDSLTLRSAPRVFTVHVPDASLRSMALRPGDVVVCEHGIESRHGDVMAALVDGAPACGASGRSRKVARGCAGPMARLPRKTPRISPSKASPSKWSARGGGKRRLATASRHRPRHRLRHALREARKAPQPIGRVVALPLTRGTRLPPAPFEPLALLNPSRPRPNARGGPGDQRPAPSRQPQRSGPQKALPNAALP